MTATAGRLVRQRMADQARPFAPARFLVECPLCLVTYTDQARYQEHVSPCVVAYVQELDGGCVLVQDEFTNLPCDCGRGPILEGNGTPDVCAACYDELEGSECPTCGALWIDGAFPCGHIAGALTPAPVHFYGDGCRISERGSAAEVEWFNDMHPYGSGRR
jgi:hypothetical protein